MPTMPTDSRRVHPWVFMVLCIPFGVSAGYASVTLPFLLKAQGVSVATITALTALTFLPQTWKFFWGPVVDITRNQRKWYVLSNLLTSIGIGAIGFFPSTPAALKILSALVFLSSLASTFLGMALESLIAHGTPDEWRGRVAGWYQAGNLGGMGLGGGLGLELAERLPSPWMASSIVGILCILCGLALFWAPHPEKAFSEQKLLPKLWETCKEVWQVARSRTGALALLLCFLPIGTSAAPFAALATEWHSSDHVVAIVTGVLGGLISAAGCFAGGWACDRMNRQYAYVWFGILQAGSCLGMAWMGRTQPMFITWTLIYNFTAGLAYAAFSAYVLEAIGKGAAATKYNMLASLSNIPIMFMTEWDGKAHDKWDSTRMFYLEAGLAVASALIFMALTKLLWPKRAVEIGN